MWTAVQLNRGVNHSGMDMAFQSPHVDSNSFIAADQSLAAFGSYSGGEIAVAAWPPEPAQATFTPQPGVREIMLEVPWSGPVGKYRRGHQVCAQVHDLRHNFVCYPPHALHCPLPYQGTRYSLVFFLSDLHAGSRVSDFNPGKVQRYLAMGFPRSSLEFLGFQLEQLAPASPPQEPAEVRAPKRARHIDISLFDLPPEDM